MTLRAFFLALLALFIVAPAHAASPWNLPAAAALLEYGQHVDSHGLEPGDYELDKLRVAMALNDQAGLDLAATRTFALLARDLANGRTPLGERRLTYYRGMGLSPDGVVELMDKALAGNDVAGTLERLAPSSPDYRMLRTALISLPADASANRTVLRANLERWRWLPRNFGERYLLVNIPEYNVRLVDGGQVVETHRVIVGKTKTPTPQFSTTVTGVILNPTWRVPQSIIAESVGAMVRNRPAEAARKGFTWTGSGKGLQVTQGPGPGNSLGQFKLEMLNPLSIYLHDTPSKGLFEQKERAYSHGCIRTDKPFDLAARLLAGTDWNAAKISRTVSAAQTVTVPLPRPLPVYIVYLTARVEPSGKLALYGDPYGLDGGPPPARRKLSAHPGNDIF